MTGDPINKRSAYMRHFTRFYTQKVGVLNDALLGSPFTLTEARLIYEIATRKQTNARQLCHDLELDPGYISRCLKKLEQQNLLTKSVDPADRRQFNLSLTELGAEKFNELDHKSSDLFKTILEELSDQKQTQLIDAMAEIQNLLGEDVQHPQPVIFRPHRAGDMGWIIKAHGEFYAKEYGWNTDFEQIVAQIAADFLKNFNATHEICWIAELAGKRIGSAMVVQQSDTVAKLRLVILDPAARGLGVGQNLVEQCLNFAREAGYQRMSLWTNSNLHAAIAIYKKLGFELMSEEPHHSFGKQLVGQHWERSL